MTAVLLPEGKQSFTSATGAPLVGGKLYTTDTGTTTPRPTWSDAAQTSLNTNPIILDARGEATIFWAGSYRVRLTDALDNAIYTVEGVSDQTYTDIALRADIATNNNASKGAGMVGFDPSVAYTGSTVGGFLYSIYKRTPAEITAGVTPTNYMVPSHLYDGVVRLYRYVTNTTPGTTNLDIGMTAAKSVVAAMENASGVIELPAGTLLFTSGISIVISSFATQVSLRGQGRGITRIKYTGTGSAVSLTGPSGSIMCQASGFTVDCSGANVAAHGITTNWWRSNFHDIRCLGPSGSTGRGFNISASGVGGFDIKCRDFYITTFGYGVYGLGDESTNTSVTNFLIEGIYCGGNAINFYFEDAFDVLVLSGQSESSTSHGIVLNNITSQFTWIGGAIEASAGYGITANSSTSVFVRGTLVNNAFGDRNTTVIGYINGLLYGAAALNFQAGSTLAFGPGGGVSPIIASVNSVSPNGNVTADTGSVVLGNDGALYLKKFGFANNTGWLLIDLAPVDDSAANIASAASALNVTQKFTGKNVWDTTNGRQMRALGPNPTDGWRVIDGSLTITPV